MSFFNKKEEVIEIQLTSYGKYRLSQGKFRPAYYAFFDDDVVYDPGYMNVVTSSRESYPETRIQDNTPSLRAQTANYSLEMLVDAVGEIQNSSGDMQKYNDAIIDLASSTTVSLPIGEGEKANVLNPAWNVKFLRGSINTGSYLASTDPAAYQDQNKYYSIPTVSASVIYSTKIYSEDDLHGGVSLMEGEENLQNYNETMGSVQVPANGYLTTYFNDASVLIVEDQYIILDVREENVIPSSDANYTVEVYEILSNAESLSDKAQARLPMYFMKMPEKIVNNILLDEGDLQYPDEALIDNSFLEYYMDIQADTEIDDNAVCNYITLTDHDKLNWPSILKCSGLYDTSTTRLYDDEEIIICEV